VCTDNCGEPFFFGVAEEVTVIRLVKVAMDRKAERMSNGDRSPGATRRDQRYWHNVHLSDCRAAPSLSQLTGDVSTTKPESTRSHNTVRWNLTLSVDGR